MPPRNAGGPGLRLVVADDQLELLALMKEALEFEGHQVRTAADGQEALDLIRADPPDVAIIDLWMPLKDGFQVCAELKSDPILKYLPVIILSAAGTRDNKIHGLDLGADDFVTKPIDLAELSARIRMITKRTRQDLDANPLTRLPGNVSIQARITEGVVSGRPLAVLYLDLDNFKAYNDAYGFDAGDQVIRRTGQIILGRTMAVGRGDFVGHIGGDDFIVVTVPERMEEIAKAVIEEFDRTAPSFYREEDARRGKIVAQDRQGKTVEYPLLSISIGICHNRIRPLSSYGQVSQLGAELKKFAKKDPGSRFVVDRRKD